jgi:membrane protein implicated in regulation of membrane protease activity
VTAVVWLGAAVALGVAELVIPGVFLVFLAIAAAITGALVFAVPDVPTAVQFGAFALWSVIAVLIGRRWYADYPVATSDPLLNDRAARLIGEIVVVEEPIVGGRGRVRIGDGTWPARGADADAGERVRVVAVEGGLVVIEPILDLTP